MPQTLLAILALSIMATLALSQSRNRLHVDQEAMRNEIAVQATAVALDQLEKLGKLPFDERITGSDTMGNREIYSAARLTRLDSFKLDAPSNDLDDSNRLEDKDFRTISNYEVWYVLNTKIEYVDYGTDANGNPTLKPVGYKTKLKRATVRAVAKDTLGINTLTGGLHWKDTISVSQTFTCGSWCDWN